MSPKISIDEMEEILTIGNDALMEFITANPGCSETRRILGTVSTKNGEVQITAYLPNSVKAGKGDE